MVTTAPSPRREQTWYPHIHHIFALRHTGRTMSTPTTSGQRETIVILDFGSQYSRLIARRIRESNVYCELLPPNTPWERIAALNPRGFVLSGGPASVYEAGAPLAPPRGAGQRPARPRHLLRHAPAGPPAGRLDDRLHTARVRSRRYRCGTREPPLRRPALAPAGLDEPRRLGGRAAARLPGGRAHRHHPRRRDRGGQRADRRAVPPGGGAYPRGCPDPAELRAAISAAATAPGRPRT